MILRHHPNLPLQCYCEVRDRKLSLVRGKNGTALAETKYYMSGGTPKREVQRARKAKHGERLAEQINDF